MTWRDWLIVAAFAAGVVAALLFVRLALMPHLRERIIDDYLRECLTDARQTYRPQTLLQMRGADLLKGRQ